MKPFICKENMEDDISLENIQITVFLRGTILPVLNKNIFIIGKILKKKYFLQNINYNMFNKKTRNV